MMYVIVVDTTNKMNEYKNTFKNIIPSLSHLITVSSSKLEGSEPNKMNNKIPHHTNKIVVRVSKNFFIMFVFDLEVKYTPHFIIHQIYTVKTLLKEFDQPSRRQTCAVKIFVW